MAKELTQGQIDRHDEVDNAIYALLLELAGKVDREDELEWDMEHIGDIRELFEDVICRRLKIMSPMDFYPWIKECGGCYFFDDGICRKVGGDDDAQCTGVCEDDQGCDRWKDISEAKAERYEQSKKE
jgi:hypothetical protein